MNTGVNRSHLSLNRSRMRQRQDRGGLAEPERNPATWLLLLKPSRNLATSPWRVDVSICVCSGYVGRPWWPSLLFLATSPLKVHQSRQTSTPVSIGRAAPLATPYGCESFGTAGFFSVRFLTKPLRVARVLRLEQSNTDRPRVVLMR